MDGQEKNNFSQREKEILELLIKGNTSEKIARTLFISKHTVDKHRSNMLQKTGAKNTAELIVKSMKLLASR